MWARGALDALPKNMSAQITLKARWKCRRKNGFESSLRSRETKFERKINQRISIIVNLNGQSKNKQEMSKERQH